MTTPSLTPAQHAILAKAIHTSAGKIQWYPDHLQGAARKKVLQALFKRALITPDGQDWCVAAEGYDALGMPRPVISKRRISPFEAHLDRIIANAESAAGAAKATQTPERQQVRPRTRANSKQAEVIGMLQRPEGATIAQICTATGWQAHTVRGTLAGVLKKKLGLTIVSDKPQGGERVYRVI